MVLLNTHAFPPCRLAVVGIVLAGFADANPLNQPAQELLAEAGGLVQQMKADVRGPYTRLRWYCNDGSVQPPTAYACRDRGGGRQHAEYSPQRERMAELGYHVGTIFAATTWEELYRPQERFQRLRELPLERYLVEIDDGWVLRKAQFYRGRIQAEDETTAGQRLLTRLYADRAWLEANFLLARELARVVPHGEDTDITRRVRRTALELAELDPSAEPLRVEIHGAPTPATAGRVRAWAERQPPGKSKDKALALASALDDLFGVAGRRTRIRTHLTALTRAGLRAPWLDVLDRAANGPVHPQIPALAEALARIRTALSNAAPEVRLLLFDLLGELEADLLITQSSLESARLSADQMLGYAGALVTASYGAGLLTAGELATVRRQMPSSADDVDALLRFVRLLRRVPQWATGAVRYTFAEALVRYSALDSRAQRFVDDLLRNSPLLLLSQIIQRLGEQTRAQTGIGANLFGRDVASAIGLNAGIASGPLRIVPSLEALERAEFARTDIVVLPETTAELQPVAGIFTLGEGNPLSHVQLLARNFAIPNVAIGADVLPLLVPHENQRVTLAVGSDGSVVLLEEAIANARLGAEPALTAGSPVELIKVPVPDLALTHPLPLAELHKGVSGRWVGPKAANLGELNRLFPGRVAPAVALPFGVFAHHTQSGKPSIRDQLEAAYTAAARGEVNEQELHQQLAATRQRIAGLTLNAETRAQLSAEMSRVFGPANDYGVFVRSDTNVEDLPQFTGAGLSETVPHVVGLERQLATIPRVWASVLSPRAIAWRSSLLANPTDVYASVLLMRSVPATKSGVLITSNLVNPGAPGLTVTTAWGVGGAVAGDAAESLVLLPDGTTELISEAKSAYRRRLGATRGIDWLPARDGQVLSRPEHQALRALANEVGDKYAPVLDADGVPRPWDIEFGFVDGELTLFQIRPLVERGQQRADRLVRLLLAATPAAKRGTAQ